MKLSGWGRFPVVEAPCLNMRDEAEARGAVAGATSLIARGNGRSYGDSCQNREGTLIDMRARNRILAFDAETGLLEAEAGTLISDIIAHAAPFGYGRHTVHDLEI